MRLPVKLAVADYLLDRRRYEITNGMPHGNPVSDIRRGNIQMPPNCRIRVFDLQTASIEDDELHQVRKFGKTVPRFEARNVVFSD